MYLLKNLNKLIFSAALTFIPLQQVSVLSSELIASNNAIEELKSSKVKKNGNLVVNFCSKLSDFSGYVEVGGTKFDVDTADTVKPKKLVWKGTNLPKTNSIDISTSNLLSDGKVVLDGDCNSNIFPIVVLLGAGIIGAAAGGGSGGTSSN
tara:strand:+ start:57 stop:506 length:450 start_codon:yes stop_codon:yes gene_type:complete